MISIYISPGLEWLKQSIISLGPGDIVSERVFWQIEMEAS